MEKNDAEIDVNKLIYDPLIKALYMDSKKAEFAACAQDRENYRLCLVKMQQSTRRKWRKECTKLEDVLMHCVNREKLLLLDKERKHKQEALEKVKIQKPNDALLKEMEADFVQKKKAAEQFKAKHEKKA